MTYALKQDLVDRFGERELVQLTDRTNKPPAAVDDVVVGRALGDADGTIDGYVGKQYALPLSVVPPVLTKVAADLARYFLHGEAAGPDSIVTRNYQAALSWLKDVSKGLVQIDDGGDTPGPAAARSRPARRTACSPATA